MTKELWGEARVLASRDDVDGVQELLADEAIEGGATLRALLLVQAVEDDAPACFELLASDASVVALGGGEALGVAARIGDLRVVHRLIEAGVGFDDPPYEPESDSDHALVGAMLSMDPEITRAICSAGVVTESDPGWVDEAMEVALSSKQRSRWECLGIFAEHLVRHIDTVIPTLDAKTVQAVGRRIANSKKMPPKTRALGEQLVAAVDQREALRETLLERIFDGEYVDALEILDRAPDESRPAWSAEALAWIAGACYADDTDHGSALWAVEALLDRRVALSGVDEYGRTALINLVWETRGLESLVRRFVEAGADVNAVHTDHNKKRASVLDYTDKNEVPGTYADLLRELGAKTAAEIGAMT